jgi:hypothetical protein|tara:strand:+ start:16945 stop:19014 length:2070 start_codon:yes stop_codon:yes gene_type:complete
MAELIHIDHEDASDGDDPTTISPGDAWDFVNNAVVDCHSVAGLNSSDMGLEIQTSAKRLAKVDLATWTKGDVRRIGFRFNLNSQADTNGESLWILHGIFDSATDHIRMLAVDVEQVTSTTFKCRAGYKKDTLSATSGISDPGDYTGYSATFTNSEDVRVELEVKRATAGNEDGYIKLWVQGTLVESKENLDFEMKYDSGPDTDRPVNEIKMGRERTSGDGGDWIGSTGSGEIYIDDFVVRDDSVSIFDSETPVDNSQKMSIESLGLIETTDKDSIESLGLIESSQKTNVESVQDIEASQKTNIESIGLVTNSEKVNIESIGLVSTTEKVNIESLGLIETTDKDSIESLGEVSTSQITSIESTGSGPIAVENSNVSSVESLQSLISDDSPIHVMHFEHGGTSFWFSSTNISGGGNFEILGAAAAPGGSFGVKVTSSGSGSLQQGILTTSKVTKETKTLKFDFNANDFNLPEGDSFGILYGTVGVNPVEGFQLRKNSGVYEFRAFVKDESDIASFTSWLAIPSGMTWVPVKCILTAATTVGGGDGSISLVMPHATSIVGSIDYDMINYQPDNYKMGIVINLSAFTGESGSFYLDNFDVRFHGGHSIESNLSLELSKISSIESLQSIDLSKITSIESLKKFNKTITKNVSSTQTVTKSQTMSVEAYTDVTLSVEHTLDILIAKPLPLDIFVS